MPLSCWFAHRQTSTTQGLHIAVTVHNCGISSRSRVHSPGYVPRIPPHIPLPLTPIMHHSPCLPDIQTIFLNSFSQYQITSSAAYHWATTKVSTITNPNDCGTVGWRSAPCFLLFIFNHFFSILFFISYESGNCQDWGSRLCPMSLLPVCFGSFFSSPFSPSCSLLSWRCRAPTLLQQEYFLVA